MRAGALTGQRLEADTIGFEAGGLGTSAAIFTVVKIHIKQGVEPGTVLRVGPSAD